MLNEILLLDGPGAGRLLLSEMADIGGFDWKEDTDRAVRYIVSNHVFKGVSFHVAAATRFYTLDTTIRFTIGRWLEERGRPADQRLAIQLWRLHEGGFYQRGGDGRLELERIDELRCLNPILYANRKKNARGHNLLLAIQCIARLSEGSGLVWDCVNEAVEHAADRNDDWLSACLGLVDALENNASPLGAPLLAMVEAAQPQIVSR